MKKLLCALICLALLAGLVPVAFAIDMGDYTWRDYTVKVTEVSDSPSFDPPSMEANERALTVTVDLPGEVVKTDKLRKAYFKDMQLVGPDDAVYEVQNAQGRGNTITFLFNVPKDTPTDQLSLRYVGEEPRQGPEPTEAPKRAAEEAPPYGLVAGAYAWRDYTVTVTEVSDNPSFDLPSMEANERALTVTVDLPGEVVKTDKLRKAYFKDMQLMGPDDVQYKVRSAEGRGNVISFLFTVPKDTPTDRLRLRLAGEEAKPIPAPTEAPKDTAEKAPQQGVDISEFAGEWEGKSKEGITLHFSVNPDGSGEYNFEQDGYTEKCPITLSADGNALEAGVPKDLPTNIKSIKGRYEYDGATLTLHITTTFNSGRQFKYSVDCVRVPPSGQ